VGEGDHLSAAIIPSVHHEDPTPRNLQERTGRHVCIRCLREVPADEYFRNDYLCDQCAESDEYPLASTPDEKKKDE
jgi:hypothetical protein